MPCLQGGLWLDSGKGHLQYRLSRFLTFSTFEHGFQPLQAMGGQDQDHPSLFMNEKSKNMMLEVLPIGQGAC